MQRYLYIFPNTSIGKKRKADKIDMVGNSIMNRGYRVSYHKNKSEVRQFDPASDNLVATHKFILEDDIDTVRGSSYNRLEFDEAIPDDGRFDRAWELLKNDQS